MIQITPSISRVTSTGDLSPELVLKIMKMLMQRVQDLESLERKTEMLNSCVTSTPTTNKFSSDDQLRDPNAGYHLYH